MATVAVLHKVDRERLAEALLEAVEKLDTADGEVVLDLSAVRRVHPAALQALEKLAVKADEKTVKVVLRGVNIEIYKVLKLARLTERFSFVN